MAKGDGPDARAAFGRLVQRYERTVLLLIQKKGHPPDRTAEDVKQDYFLTVMARGYLKDLERTRKFRGWLYRSVTNFLANTWDGYRAKKFGNLVTGPLLHDCHAHECTPDKLYLRAYAEDTVRHVLARHRADAPNRERFELLKEVLPGPQMHWRDRAELAARLGLKLNALAKAICDLREKHHRFLREAVAETLDVDATDPMAQDAIRVEMRLLYECLSDMPDVEFSPAQA
jgi:DNA-directed RNA polymerase specialized sigma24 family protein